MLKGPQVINGYLKVYACQSDSKIFKYLLADSPLSPIPCSQTTKVIISGIPQHAHFSDVEPLLKQYGNVEECDAVASKDPKTQTVHITFETYEQAQR